MGLMLSILVVCVGVIEALSCYEHFQNGVIHYATNIYESTRRSSLFLSYTSRKLGYLAKESAPELNGKREKSFKPFISLDESNSISEDDNLSNEEPYCCKPVQKPAVISLCDKKLEKQDKIDIVKKHFARPAVRRSKPLRSLSMPELTPTEEDVELSKIINDLAIEPIEEIDVEIETTKPENSVKEFEELFSQYESLTLSHVGGDKNELEDTAQIASSLKGNEVKVELNLNEKDNPEVLVPVNLNASSNDCKSKKDINGFDELKKKFFEEKIPNKSFSSKSSDVEPVVGESYSKEALVKQFLSQGPEKRQLKRSVSAFESRINSAVGKNISSGPAEQISDPPELTSTSAIPFDKSFDFDGPDPLNKLPDAILENETPTEASVEMIDKTFEEIYDCLNDESLDVINICKEMDKIIVNKVEREEEKIKNIDVKLEEPQINDTGVESSSVLIFGENIPQIILMKAIDQFAELLVKDCLKEVKNFRLKQFADLNIPRKRKANDVKDGTKELEVKLENCLMEKPNTSGINDNFQPEIKNSEILEDRGMQLLGKDKMQSKQILEEENRSFENAPTENPTTLTTEAELPKSFEKLEYGILIDSENEKASIDPEIVKNVSEVLEGSFINAEGISNPEEKHALRETQQVEDLETGNGLTENIPGFGLHDKNDKEIELSIREKTPPPAIKAEDLLALEYKNVKSEITQALKTDIIPMEWKTAVSKESGIAGSFPQASEDLLKMSHSENENNSKQSEKQNKEEKEEIGELELPSEVNKNFSVESDPNFGNSGKVTDSPNSNLQTLELGIFQPTGKTRSETEKQMQVENLDSKALHNNEQKGEFDVIAGSLTYINSNPKLLAIKDQVLPSLEYKNAKNDINQENKKETIAMEWKTSIHNENIGLTNKDDLIVSDTELSLSHKETHECQKDLEKPILNPEKLLELASAEVEPLAAVSGPEQFIAESNTDVFKPRESSKSILIQNTEHRTFPETQGDDSAKTEILKQNLEKTSITPKPKPDSESFRSLSRENDSRRETIVTGESCGGNECVPEIKKLVESEKEGKSEFSNDSKKLNARNNNREAKDTNSAPEAFWLIFSGEYTKAMSKDWHSGHFSCWQCDEALTGQRYVLRDDHPYCIKCYESVFANVCEECNKIIGIDSKDLSYKDKHWHEACFLCNKCRVSLVDKQFGSKADKIYCGNCYDAQFASRCDGCGEIFRAGTKKMEYKTRQWHEKCFCCCVCKTPIGTKSFIPREQEIYCATCYEEKFATRCVKCNKIITSGGVTYKNEPWHRECFTCTNCNTSLAGQRFTSRDEKPYCADCFGELFAKRCTACSRPITGIGGTRFISFEDRHWHNDCFICASCKTSLVGRGFITDGDDIICPECAKQKLM